MPKRFFLQTSEQHYALHLDPASVPMTEDTPVLRVNHAKCYFLQENLLTSWSAKHNTTWTVTRPGFIIGANEGAAIDIAHTLAIYASVPKALGVKLEFRLMSRLGCE